VTLVEELLAPAHKTPIDPTTNYRTRRVGLFEEAAAEILRLEEALESMKLDDQ
jgi:hypothetical protein